MSKVTPLTRSVSFVKAICEKHVPSNAFGDEKSLGFD